MDTWAVGAEPNPNQYLTAPLAEHWDGTRWSIVPTPAISAPTVQLNSIAAVNSGNVWAAGYSEDPNCHCGKNRGRALERQSLDKAYHSKSRRSRLLGRHRRNLCNRRMGRRLRVDIQRCRAPPLLHYDGRAWRRFNTSRLQFGQLSSVFARSTNDVWAVGWTGRVSNINALACTGMVGPGKGRHFPPKAAAG
jgi:hypothetical protein